jgi:hypothetical protein
VRLLLAVYSCRLVSTRHRRTVTGPGRGGSGSGAAGGERDA